VQASLEKENSSFINSESFVCSFSYSLLLENATLYPHLTPFIVTLMIDL